MLFTPCRSYLGWEFQAGSVSCQPQKPWSTGLCWTGWSSSSPAAPAALFPDKAEPLPRTTGRRSAAEVLHSYWNSEGQIQVKSHSSWDANRKRGKGKFFFCYSCRVVVEKKKLLLLVGFNPYLSLFVACGELISGRS